MKLEKLYKGLYARKEKAPQKYMEVFREATRNATKKEFFDAEDYCYEIAFNTGDYTLADLFETIAEYTPEGFEKIHSYVSRETYKGGE